MKKIVLARAIFLLILGIGLLSPKAEAQLKDMGIILTGGAGDAEKIAGAYLSPFTDAFGVNLNSGWFNTAKTHKLFGLDLTISGNVAIVPTDAKSMNLTNLGLSGIVVGGSESPTIAAGTATVGGRLRYQEGGNTLAIIDLPKGAGLGYVPSPVLQVGVGLPYNTEIIGRFVPEVNMGLIGKAGLWGVGIKHGIKQYIPGLSRTPSLNLSIMGGYTRFNTGAALNFQPSHVNATDMTSPGISFADQNLELAIESYTANILASFDIPVLTVYAGAGMNTSTSNLKMLGYYPVPELDGTTRVVTDQSALLDPVDMKFNGNNGKINPQVTGGLKLKISVVHIYGGYTYSLSNSSYQVVTAGIGVSLR
jgi:hypothetical protein